MHYHPAMTRATLTTAVVAAALAVVAPAHAAHGKPAVTPSEFVSVGQWDVKEHVELTLDRSGRYEGNHYRDADGNRYREKVYPTTVKGATAFVTYRSYTLDPATDRHPYYTWVLWSKTWCDHGVCTSDPLGGAS